ncbi:hypothetical protein Taro_003316 [Colocasia esculenta]|uniref:Uncharacterized protein n=1 Tax=Colocasia esculenta TaxID=4460 RepID=A0A843TJE9_COLES|nr:hypothetical protein [Colocasia esculenta]
MVSRRARRSRKHLACLGSVGGGATFGVLGEGPGGRIVTGLTRSTHAEWRVTRLLGPASRGEWEGAAGLSQTVTWLSWGVVAQPPWGKKCSHGGEEAQPRRKRWPPTIALVMAMAESGSRFHTN